MLLLALFFFLELTCYKYHVDSSTPCTEPTLTLWEETLLKVLQKAIEKDVSQDLSSYGQEGDVFRIKVVTHLNSLRL